MRSLLILLFVLFSSSCTYPVKNTDSKGRNIICFGDSITYGVGAQMGRTYPFYLSKLTGVEVINAGVPGDTTESALLRLGKDVLSKNPYLVIVELGGNDFLSKVPLKVTISNLEKIIMAIQKRGAMVALCDVSDGVFMSAYSRRYRILAKKRGAIFVPFLLKGIMNDSSLKYDYIHPNSKGYQIISRRIFNAIEEYVRSLVNSQ